MKAPEGRGRRLVRDVTVGSGQASTIPETVTLTIGDGVTLTVENGGTLTNDGEIVVEDGGGGYRTGELVADSFNAYCFERSGGMTPVQEGQLLE